MSLIWWCLSALLCSLVGAACDPKCASRGGFCLDSHCVCYQGWRGDTCGGVDLEIYSTQGKVYMGVTVFVSWVVCLLMGAQFLLKEFAPRDRSPLACALSNFLFVVFVVSVMIECAYPYTYTCAGASAMYIMCYGSALAVMFFRTWSIYFPYMETQDRVASRKKELPGSVYFLGWYQSNRWMNQSNKPTRYIGLGVVLALVCATIVFATSMNTTLDSEGLDVCDKRTELYIFMGSVTGFVGLMWGVLWFHLRFVTYEAAVAFRNELGMLACICVVANVLSLWLSMNSSARELARTTVNLNVLVALLTEIAVAFATLVYPLSLLVFHEYSNEDAEQLTLSETLDAEPGHKALLEFTISVNKVHLMYFMEDVKKYKLMAADYTALKFPEGIPPKDEPAAALGKKSKKSKPAPWRNLSPESLKALAMEPEARRLMTVAKDICSRYVIRDSPDEVMLSSSTHADTVKCFEADAGEEVGQIYAGTVFDEATLDCSATLRRVVFPQFCRSLLGHAYKTSIGKPNFYERPSLWKHWKLVIKKTWQNLCEAQVYLCTALFGHGQ